MSRRVIAFDYLNSHWVMELDCSPALTSRADHQIAVFAMNAEESFVDQLMLFQEGPPARTSPWLDAVKDWMALGADCSGINAVSLMNALPLGFSGRTSLELCPATWVPTSLPCCGASQAHLRGCPMEGGTTLVSLSDRNGGLSGGCLTLNGLEWPNDAAVCSLSAVLEPTCAPKYFLSARACQGIIRRAERRGKRLPAHLEEALQAVAQNQTPTE